MNEDQHKADLERRQQQIPTSGPAYLNNLGQSLLDACRNGYVGQVQHLINYGAPYVEDWLGNSALHFAAMNGHRETCLYLLNTGIKRDVRTKVDRTPLHLAAQEGHHDVVELLLKNGADRNAFDGLRMTALHWACENSHVPVIQILMTYGANTELQDKFGRTPLMICAGKDHLESCQAICRALYPDSDTEVVLSHSGETESINLLAANRASAGFPAVRPAAPVDDDSFLQRQAAPPVTTSSGGSGAESEPEGILAAANGVNGSETGNEATSLSVPVEEEGDMGRWPVSMDDDNEVRTAARNVLEQLDMLEANNEESEVKVDGLPDDGGVSWLLNFLEMEGLSTEWENQDEGVMKGHFISNGRQVNCRIRITEQHLIFKVTLEKEVTFKQEMIDDE